MTNSACKKIQGVLLVLAWCFASSGLFAQELVVNTSALTVVEGESQGLTVKLSEKPSGDVTVALVILDGVELILDKTELTFTPDDYDAIKFVRVSAEEDADSTDSTGRLVLIANGGGYGSEFGIGLSPQRPELELPGDTVRLAAQLLDQVGAPLAGVPIEWSSLNPDVAVVDASGKVTAVAGGFAVIKATWVNTSGTAIVKVGDFAITDRDILELLFHLTGGEQWTRRDGWLTDAPLNEWYGVDLSGGTVTHLNLPKNNLGGQVLGDLGQLSSLESLDLSDNGISGPIPPELGKLSSLESLDLSGNGISGSIPSELCELSSLESLDLSGNNISGPITPELGSLRQLQTLSLNENPLTGVLPDEIGNLTELQKLDLGYTALDGAIPSSLGELVNLRELILKGVPVTGGLPDEIGNLTQLQILDLGFTQLSGAIPSSLGKLVNLRELNFESGWTSGSIPPELGALVNLEFLNLFRNRLSGTLPAELGALGNLRSLIVDDNLLTGSIPSMFTRLNKLDSFFWAENLGLCAPATPGFEAWHAKGHDFRGPRCNDGDVAALKLFYEATGGAGWTHSDGWLDGVLLNEWYGVTVDSLGRATELDLTDNGLRGELARPVGALDNLSVLRVGGNALSGRVPMVMANIALKEFRYADTDLCVSSARIFQRWLAAIPIHQGTGDQCPSLTDREILAILYESTGGENWGQRDRWLTDAPLGDWHGVKTDSEGHVIELVLWGNELRGRIPWELGDFSAIRLLDISNNRLEGPIPSTLGGIETLEELYLEKNMLTGQIPPELGSLRRLTSMYLRGNRLDGRIPPQLGSLSNLEDLRISQNRLAGPIPPELGNLSKVVMIWMDDNELEGSIPPELGNMSSLEILYAGLNNMSGSIPPELGNLRRLRDLGLEELGLTGTIPPELGDLPNMTGEVNLRLNNLSGEIPIELGKLNRLTKLRLGHNNLSGSLEAIRGMRDLEWLDLAHNPELGGPLPPFFANLPNLVQFEIEATTFCVEEDSPLVSGTFARRVRVPFCTPPTESSTAYLIQSTQSASYPVPLIAGQDALLRVFPITSTTTNALVPPARATFFVNGAEVHAVELPGQASPLATELAWAEASLTRSANVRVPSSVVQPGLEMVVEIDPAGALDPSIAMARRIPESGRAPVAVEALPTLELTLIPFMWQDQPDPTAGELVTEMVQDPKGHRLLADLLTMMPVGDISVRAHPTVLTSDNSDELLDEVTAIRRLEGGSGYWMGVLSGEAVGAWGVAWIDGWTSYMRLGIVTQEEEALTLAHEIGHSMSLGHAPCGTSSVLDGGYPHKDGSIGNWGLDTRSGIDILVPPARSDVMSYCVPAWVSEYNFFLAMKHRLKRESSGNPVMNSGPALLVWGGTDDEGVPYLNPVFVVDTPPSAPTSSGEYQLVGRAADGDIVFSMNAGMMTSAHDEARGGFALTIPSNPEWTDILASVELIGLGGSATIDATTDQPVTILRERATGRVRAILRDSPETIADSKSPDAVRSLLGASDVEILFSRGLPSLDNR